MKKIVLSFLVFFALVSGSALQAQETAKVPAWTRYVSPSGYFQTGYSTDQYFNNSFYIKRVRVSLLGTVLESPKFGKLEYKVQADLAGTPKLVDYWFKYTLRDEFGIQLGQFKTPLSIENSEYPPLKLEMIDYSLLIQRMCRMSTADVSGISATGREMGLMFYGKLFPIGEGHHLVRYDLAVFNGNGINKTDDDKRKDFMARMMIYPIKDLCVAGYYMRTLGPHPEIAPEYNDYDWYVYDRYGGGLAYSSKYGWLRGEYMAGHSLGYRSHGLYGTIGYNIDKAWSVGFRYDYFVPNSRMPENAQRHYTGAVNWMPSKHFRLQLNYSYRLEPGQGPLHFVNLMTTVAL
ncbi:MAG: hypothetical protein IKS47_00390 [Bacteroidales bacterium]|nr:hypothetical protein [Bacteroidales bacterium]